MTKRLLDVTEAAAAIKRHCTQAIDRAKRSRSEENLPENYKRIRLEENQPVSTERFQGRQEGWIAGHSQGVKEGREAAAKIFHEEVVPEMEKLVRQCFQELNQRHDLMFLELCQDFGHQSGARLVI